MPPPLHLTDLTTDALAALLAGPERAVALVPVGSVEPHGPHLPLSTDTLIGEAVALRAASRLREHGFMALVAPAVAYGVTDFATGFAGAVSIPAPALSAFLRAVVQALGQAGFVHVCLVNNHLEPAHDAAVRDAIVELPAGSASVACPLTRRWARTLSAEFKSGACHAGRYETSLVLAHAPERVDLEAARALPAVPVSLSQGILAGASTFAQMGMERAYAGAPAEASAEEGAELVDRLAAMVVAEVEEGLAATASRG